MFFNKFAKKWRIISILFGVLVCLTAYQNCSEVSFHSTSSKHAAAVSSGGNGGPYEGKPEGVYHRVIPDHTCELQPAARATIEANGTDVLSITNNYEQKCGVRKDNLSLSAVSVLPNKDLIGYRGGIFKRFKKSAVIASIAQIPQAWCESKDHLVHAVVEKNLNSGAYFGQLFVRTGQWNQGPTMALSFVQSGQSLNAVGEGFHLTVNLDQRVAGHLGKVAGHFSGVVQGSDISKDVICRTGYNYDPEVIAPAAGTTTTGFGAGGKVTIDFTPGASLATDMVVTSANKLVVTTENNSNAFYIGRYSSVGTLDASFASIGWRQVTLGSTVNPARVIEDTVGNYIVAATMGTSVGLVKVRGDGGLESSFGSGGVTTLSLGGSADHIDDVQQDGSGRFIASVTTTNNTSYSDVGLIRWNPDGTLDAGFGASGKVLFSDSRGHFARANSVQINPLNQIHLGFQLGSNLFAWSVFESNGDILPRSGFNQPQHTEFDVSRSFCSSSCEMTAIKLLPDGGVLAAGRINGDFALIKFNEDGSLNADFGVGGVVTTEGYLSDYVESLTLQSDGKILLAGYTPSPSFGGILMRYDDNGEMDYRFGNGGILYLAPDIARISSVKVNDVGDILVYGSDESNIAIQMINP